MPRVVTARACLCYLGRMKGYYVDSESSVVEEHFALVYAPGRRRRDRYPENCVTLVDTEQQALDGEDSANRLFAARVLGPARSSEGLRLYYLVTWLTTTPRQTRSE